MIDFENIKRDAEFAEYKLAHPTLKSKIVEGLPKNEKDIILYGVRFFSKNGKQFAEVLYDEVDR